MAAPTAGAVTLAPTPQARNRLFRWLVPIGLGVIILLIPKPAGLTPAAWHYFALFVMVISGLITEPIPGPALGFMGVSAGAALIMVGKTPTESMRWALSGFSNDTVWLIFAATMFAAGYEATGLGRRIALLLVKALGRKTLGLGYAIAIADLVLAPFMPSNTARSGGTIFPVVKNIPGLYGSSPTDHPRKIGAYLCWTAFVTTCVTSAMFVTAMAPNLLACELARKIAHVDVTWTGWMMGFLPAGLLMFALTPLLVYLIYPPEIKEGDAVAKWAGAELTAMGPISRREITMAALAVLALVAWIFGAHYIAAVTVAMAVISLMILTKVVSWNDIMQNKQGWNILVWFATLVAMADGLSRAGFLVWFAQRSAGALGGHTAGADDDRADRALLFRALSVCQHLGPHGGGAAGLSGGDCGRQRTAGEGGNAGADLLDCLAGRADALCDRAGADLVQHRLYQHERFLAAGVHLRRVLPGNTAGGGPALCAALHALDHPEGDPACGPVRRSSNGGGSDCANHAFRTGR